MHELFFSLHPADLSMNAVDVILRLLCALTLGAIIGTEREYTNRPAGMRTHMLVSLGACVVMIVSQILYLQYSPQDVRTDPARMGAQVISGVGFLGAGTILREGLTVKGLTTAASLWATACLGLAAGCGYWMVALCGTVFIFITLSIFELIQHRIFRTHRLSEDYVLKTTDPTDCMALLRSCAKAHRVVITQLHIHRLGSSETYSVSFHAAFNGPRADTRMEDMLAELASADCVVAAESTGTMSYCHSC